MSAGQWKLSAALCPSIRLPVDDVTAFPSCVRRPTNQSVSFQRVFWASHQISLVRVYLPRLFFRWNCAASAESFDRSVNACVIHGANGLRVSATDMNRKRARASPYFVRTCQAWWRGELTDEKHSAFVEFRFFVSGVADSGILTKTHTVLSRHQSVDMSSVKCDAPCNA